jgi:hypothetical protein
LNNGSTFTGAVRQPLAGAISAGEGRVKIEPVELK